MPYQILGRALANADIFPSSSASIKPTKFRDCKACRAVGLGRRVQLATGGNCRNLGAIDRNLSVIGELPPISGKFVQRLASFAAGNGEWARQAHDFSTHSRAIGYSADPT
jgi:hypothetical protein